MSQRIKLYLDEDAQRTDLIQALRARQIDVTTVSEANLLGQADPTHLQHAARQQRFIFTFNRGDFFRLHTEWLNNGKHHSGIIVSDQVATGTIVRRLLRLLNTKSDRDMHDWLEFLSNWG
ncbi:MAG: DUF5615 family PIN-like protein [Ardenticatenaceae bacterium]|nr:DUF5615 family PIN-like protein [Ardenticatenaceae bacterium]